MTMVTMKVVANLERTGIVDSISPMLTWEGLLWEFKCCDQSEPCFAVARVVRVTRSQSYTLVGICGKFSRMVAEYIPVHDSA